VQDLKSSKNKKRKNLSGFLVAVALVLFVTMFLADSESVYSLSCIIDSDCNPLDSDSDGGYAPLTYGSCHDHACSSNVCDGYTVQNDYCTSGNNMIEVYISGSSCVLSGSIDCTSYHTANLCAWDDVYYRGYGCTLGACSDIGSNYVLVQDCPVVGAHYEGTTCVVGTDVCSGGACQVGTGGGTAYCSGDELYYYYPANQMDCAQSHYTCSASSAYDADSGLNYNTQATCSVGSSGCSAGTCPMGSGGGTDYCTGSTLTEYYASGISCGTTAYTCAEGCSNGACLQGGRVSLTNSSTWANKLYPVQNRSNSSFIVIGNITLFPNQVHRVNTTFPLFLFNNSYTLDCNGSRIIGNGQGTAVQSRFNNTIIKNCIFENFGTGVSVFDINDSSVPITEWNWTKNTSADFETFMAITVDKNGDYSAGGTEYNGADAIWRVFKISSNGTTIWNWTQNPSASDSEEIKSIKSDNQGNIIVAGTDFYPGNWQWRVVKISSDGTTLWNWTQNASSDADTLYSIAVDQNNDYIAAGLDSTQGNYQWRVVKISSDGNTIWNWTQNPSTNADYLISVTVDQNGDYLATGHDFSTGDYQWRVVKISSNGTTIWNWTQNPSNTLGDFPKSIEPDQNGDYVVAGIDNSMTGVQWRVVKISSNGTTIWNWTQNPSTISSGDFLSSIVIDQEGNYLAAGKDDSETDTRWRVVKIASNGTTIWNWTQNPSTTNDDQLYQIAVDQKGDYIAAGYDNIKGDYQFRVVKLKNVKNRLAGVFIQNTSIYTQTKGTLLSLPNASATITNMTVGYNASYGKINYPALSAVNGTLALGRNILLDPYFVSLDSADAVAKDFNRRANITLKTLDCNNQRIKRITGFPQTLSAILAGEIVSLQYYSCNTDTTTFTTTEATDSFSGYGMSPPDCLNLNNASTWSEKIYNVSSKNTSFILYKNTTLCSDEIYNIHTIHNLFIFNRTNIYLDCSGSRIVGNGLGVVVLSRHNNTAVRNCQFENFGTGVNVLNLNGSTVPKEVWNWTSNPSSSDDIARSVKIDQAGNYIIAGYDLSLGNTQLHVEKISVNGSSIWNWTQNPFNNDDFVYDVAVDQQGDIIVVGEDTISSQRHTRIVKISSNGTTLWNWTADDVYYPNSENPYSLAIDQNEDIIFGGYYPLTSGSAFYAVKLYSNGTFSWNWTQDATLNTNDIVYSVAVDQNNDILLAGNSYKAAGDDNWRVMKLSSNGTTLWNWTQDASIWSDRVFSLSVDQENNYVTAGADYTTGLNQWRVVKISRNGTTLWNWTYNPSVWNDILYSVAIDQANDIIVAGYESADGASDYKWRVAKVLSNGSTVWSMTQNPSVYGDYPYSAAVDQAGDILIAGTYDAGANNHVLYLVKFAVPKNIMSGISISNVTIFNPNMETLLALPNASVMITNLTVGYNSTVGKINYPVLNAVNGTLALGRNVLMDTYFVSLDSADAGAKDFNRSANITLKVNSCRNINYIKKTGFSQNRTATVSGTAYTPSYSTCSDKTATFSTTDAFSGYTTDSGCVDMSDTYTWTGNITLIGTTSFYVLTNLLLCDGQDIQTNTIHNYLILNGSYYVDCQGSKLTGKGLGTAVRSNYSNTKIRNCEFSNFNTGVSVFDIRDNPALNTTWNWTANPSAGNERLYSIAVDKNGEYLAAGFDNIPGNLQWSLLKISNNGTNLWNWTSNPSGYEDFVYSVAVDQNGNYILGGSATMGAYVWRAVKLSSSGTTIWNWTQNLTGSFTNAIKSVAVDQNQDYIVGGIDYSVATWSQWRVVKISSNGTTLWNWTYNPTSGNDYVTSIAVDQNGDYVVAGTYQPGSSYMWNILKISSNGTTLWNWTQTLTGNEIVYSVAVDQEGNYVAAGYDEIPGSGNTEWRVIKLSSNGTLLWNWTQNPSTGYDGIYSIAVDQNNDYVAVGYDISTGDYQFRVVKLSSNGTTIANWTQDPSTAEDYLYSVAVDQNGDYIAAGWYKPANDQWRVVKLTNAKNLLSGVSITNVSIYDTGKATLIALQNTSATITNLTVGYNSTIGKINYPFIYAVNGTLALGRNMLLNPWFVSLDSADRDAIAFNAEANITIQAENCANYSIYKAPGFPQNLTTIIANGYVAKAPYKTCAGGVITFTTYYSFSGYTIGNYTNSPPTHDTPAISSTYGTNYSNENITAYNQSTADYDSHAVKNIINWHMNGSSITVLNMPFESWGTNGTHTISNISKDYSPYSNNGTVINGAVWNQTGGYDGRGAYQFDGVNDYISIPHTSSLNISPHNFTVMFWIKPATLSLDTIIAKAVAPYTGGWMVYIQSSNILRLQLGDGNGASIERTTDAALQTNTWAHIVVVIEPGVDVRFYKNGTQLTTDDALTEWYKIGTNAHNIEIGSFNSGANDLFSGVIDEVVIFNKSLNESQIKAIYQNKTDMIVSAQLSAGQNWSACITPNDGYEDGLTKCSSNLTVRSSGSYAGCVDPGSSYTWTGNLEPVSGSSRSFKVLRNITLCAGNTYTTDTIHNLFIMNSSNTLDCANSRVMGEGMGAFLLSTFNNTQVKNCEIANFSKCIIISRPSNAQASNITWNLSHNTYDTHITDETIFQIAEDRDGNYVTAGYADAPSYKKRQVKKISHDGTFLWVWSESSVVNPPYLYSVAVDKEGNYVAAGQGYFNPGANIIKLSSDGNLIWKKSYLDSIGGGFLSVAVDQDGNYITAGYISGFINLSAIKFDSDGNQIWNWTRDGQNSEFDSVAVDQNGDYIFSGMDYKDSSSGKGIILKLSNAGVHLWNWTFETPGADTMRSVAVDHEGNYIVAADNESFLHIFKFTKDGTQLFNTSWNLTDWNHLRSVAVDDDGNYIFAGEMCPQWNDCAFYLDKRSRDGQNLWNLTLNHSDDDDMLFSVIVDAKGDYVAAGLDGLSPIMNSQSSIMKLSPKKEIMRQVSLDNVSVYNQNNKSTLLSLQNASATLRNVTVGYNSTAGKINYPALNAVNGTLTLGRNILLDPMFVSLDSNVSDARNFNVSANITIASHVTHCSIPTYYKLSEFPQNRTAILSQGLPITPAYYSCNNGILTFSTVNAFSGYAVSTNDTDGDGDPDNTDCAPNDPNVMSPYDNLNLTRSITLCNGTYLLTDSGTDGIIKALSHNNAEIRCNSTIIKQSTGLINQKGMRIYKRSNISIVNCTFEDFALGVIVDTSNNTRITNNTFLNVSDTVYLTLTNHSIISNNLYDSSDNAISLDFLADNTTISNNTFINTIFNAVTIYNSKAGLISYNLFFNSTKHIEMDYVNFTVIRNNLFQITDINDYAIDIFRAGNVNITNNTFQGSNISILLSDGYSNNIFHNTINSSGYDILSDISSARNNNIYLNQLYGRGANDSTQYNTYCKNVDGTNEGNFYINSTPRSLIGWNDCGPANITAPIGGEFNNQVPVTWKKQSSTLLPVTYYIQLSNTTGENFTTLNTTTSTSVMMDVSNLSEGPYTIRVIPFDGRVYGTYVTSAQNLTIDRSVPVTTDNVTTDNLFWYSNTNATVLLNATAKTGINFTIYCVQNIYDPVQCQSNIRFNNTQYSNMTIPVNVTCAHNSVCQVRLRYNSSSNTQVNEPVKESDQINIVFNSYINHSYLNNTNVTNLSTILDSNLTDSIVDGCYVERSIIINSTLKKDPQYHTPCVIINSTVLNSRITSAKAVNSFIDPSNITESTILNSTIPDAVIEFSVLENVSLCGGGFHIFGAAILNDILSAGQIDYQGSSYFPTFNIDDICLGMPGIVISIPIPGSVVNGTFNVTFSTPENRTPQISMDGAGYINTDTNTTYLWNTTNLTEGSHSLQVRDLDETGAYKYSVRINVIVDNTPDGLTILRPLSGATISGDQTAEASAPEWTSRVEFMITNETGSYSPQGGSGSYMDTDSADGWSANWSTTTFSDGIYNITAKAYTRCFFVFNCVNATDTETNIRIANYAPNAPANLIIKESPYDTDGFLMLNWSSVQASDIAYYRLYRSNTRGFQTSTGTLIQTVTLNHTNDTVPSGVYHYKVTAVDLGGVESAPSNEANVTVDLTGPVGTLSITPSIVKDGSMFFMRYNGIETGLNITLDTSVVDSNGAVVRLNDSDMNAVYDANHTVSSGNTRGDGNYTLTAVILDSAGNLLNTSATITLDNSAPIGNMTIMGSNGSILAVSRNVMLDLYYNDTNGVTGCRFANDNSSYLANSTFTPCSSVMPWILSDGEGNKTVFAELTDFAGNTVTINDTIIYSSVQDLTPPSVPTVYDGIRGDDLDWWNDNTKLSAHWTTSIDDISITYYKYLIRINSTAGCIPQDCNHTSTGLETSVTRTNLSLTEGTNYSFEVIAYNPWNITATPATTDGMIIDITRPTTPTINSSTHPIGVAVQNKTPEFNWSATDINSSGVMSGVIGYSYTLDTHPGSAPDDELEQRYEQTVNTLKNNGAGKTLKDNSTGKAFAVFTEIEENITAGDTIKVRFAAAETGQDLRDKMPIDVYVIKKAEADGSGDFDYNETDNAVSSISRIDQDIAYAENLRDAQIYSTEVTINQTVNGANDALYIVVAGVYSDDDNRNNLSIAANDDINSIDNTTRNFYCIEAATCTENTTTLDYAIEVKSVENSTVQKTRYEDLTDGTYYFHVKAKDLAGNWGDTAHYMITVNKLPGIEIMITDPFTGQLFSNPNISVTVQVSSAAQVTAIAKHTDGSNHTTQTIPVNTTYTFTDVEIEQGTTEIYAVAKGADNITVMSQKVYVIYGETAMTSANKTLYVSYNTGGTATSHMAYAVSASNAVGLASENDAAIVSGAGSLSILSDTSNIATKIFVTKPAFDVSASERYLANDEFLDLVNPSFGLLQKNDQYVISSELRYKNIYITGSRNLDKGKYLLVIKDIGKDAQGKENITITIV
jgi:uncharacterized delta-60 repeat protein